VFKPSIKEIFAVGLPLLAFAGLAEGQPKDVQFMAALWGGFIGALFWFIIIRAEFIDPFKFIVVFMVLPGFLLGGSYFAYRKPAELKPISHQLERIAKGEITRDDASFTEIQDKKNALLLNLAKTCGWIWLVGSAFAALILGPIYARYIRRFDYAYQDCKRSRGMLGKKPTEVHPRYLPPKVREAGGKRISFPSDLPPQRRIREPAESLLVGADDEDKNYWVS
jgi:hypothetical protein